MANAIPLRSKTTGLVGMYPPGHLDLDSDLERVYESPCLECQSEIEKLFLEPDPDEEEEDDEDDE